jgi:hypothetical protein
MIAVSCSGYVPKSMDRVVQLRNAREKCNDHFTFIRHNREQIFLSCTEIHPEYFSLLSLTVPNMYTAINADIFHVSNILQREFSEDQTSVSYYLNVLIEKYGLPFHLQETKEAIIWHNCGFKVIIPLVFLMLKDVNTEEKPIYYCHCEIHSERRRGH